MTARLIDKHEASKRTGIPVETFTYWIRTKALPFVQPAGPNGRAYFSSTLIDNLIKKAEGEYVVRQPSFAEPAEGSDPDNYSELSRPVRGYGLVHITRAEEFERYKAARDAGKSVAEAIAAAEAVES